MAKITRYTGNLLAFAANATGTNRTVFGDVTQSDTLNNNVNADFLTGWEIVGVNENPTREDFNAMGFTLGQLIAYLHQWGVAEWDSLQEYNDGSITNVGGVLFESQTDANIGNDPTTDDGTNWRQLDDNSVTVTTITPAADANVTLTVPQYRSEILILQDGAWTAGRSIIVPNQSRLYWVDNSAGTYNALITTSGGTGITVTSGTSRPVVCDGTNVIDPLNVLITGDADIILNNGTTDTPAIQWNDPVNNTLLNADIANEHFRFFYSYRGGPAEFPFDIDLSSGTITMAGLTFDFTRSHLESGYQKLPGGLILQWGSVTDVGAGVDLTWTFPIAFSTGWLNAHATANVSGSTDYASITSAVGATNSLTFRKSNPNNVKTLLFAIGV